MRSKRPPTEPSWEGHVPAQPFLAVSLKDQSWVVDLRALEQPLVGEGGAITLDEDEEPISQGQIFWDGVTLHLEETEPEPPIFVNGKPIEGRMELGPGDELRVGPLHIVVGIANPQSAQERRVLTHQELRERLREEVARAARAGRPTTLAMLEVRAGEGGRVIDEALGTLRAGDVVAVYAPDRVELLFADTAPEDATKVIRRILEGAQVEGGTIGLAASPVDAEHPERLLRGARLALDHALREGKPEARPPATEERSAVDPIVRDKRTIRLNKRLSELAQLSGPVLVRGEASSGKGVFARQLHHLGPRAAGPLVMIRCARLISEAAQVEAFGSNGSPNALSRARGGTLLLDEVASLELSVQERLAAALRSLRDAEEEAGQEPSLRLVATTQHDLRDLGARGAFSYSLLAQLDGEEVRVPPLRARPDDIVPLAECFAEEAGAETLRISVGALARLRSYPWPGNVLELRNAVERAVLLARDSEILAQHLPSDGLPAQKGDGRLREHVDSVERDAIFKALAESNHNQTRAAKRLGISRRALIYKMEKYGLKKPPGSRRPKR